MTDWQEELGPQVAAEIERALELLRQPGSDRIGRILRAHLIVENRLREFLQFMNPNLGPLEDLNLQFHHLLKMYSGMPKYAFPWLAKGIQALQQVRNKLGHRLAATISPTDMRPMASTLVHWKELSLTQDQLERAPTMTCELFAILACMVLAAVQAGQRQLNNLQAQLDAMHEESLRAWSDLQGEPNDPS